MYRVERIENSDWSILSHTQRIDLELEEMVQMPLVWLWTVKLDGRDPIEERKGNR